MPCHHVNIGGTRAIVCTSRGRRPKPCSCGSGKPADLLCDWKVPNKRSGTCDRPLCAACSHVPAPNKDLCPEHAKQWKARAR